MNNNLAHWNKLSQVPTDRLKTIGFGYLKGKSDINPQWRIMAMTEAFGVIGFGWNYRIVRTWSEKGEDGQVMCFAEVAVKVKIDGEWGEEFSGIGGSMICELAGGKVKSNDEGYKMATTDALGVALKFVGVAASIYLGDFNGSKYLKAADETALVQPPAPQPARPQPPVGKAPCTENAFQQALNRILAGEIELAKKVKDSFALTEDQIQRLIAAETQAMAGAA